MTFDGFDAALLIESGNFMPDIFPTAELASATPDAAPAIESCGCSRGRGAASEPAPMTLEEALREAARAERVANRAEALVLDLWVGPGGADGFDILDLPARGMTSARAWAVSPDEVGRPEAPDGGKDWSFRAASYGEGDSEEEEEIVVKGTKTKDADDDDGGGGVYPGSGVPGDDGGMGDGPGGGGGEEQQNDCGDRNALQAKDEIRADENSGYKEHGSVIYRDSSGAVRHSPPIEGGWGQIPQSAITAWMTANGISFTQVIGFAHNHDPYNYGAAADLNRYPSGGDVPGGDWNAADWFVNNGAGGPGGENFSLYIIDTGWKVREFHYRDREMYKDLNQDQRERGVALPDPLASDGGSCG